MDKQEQIIVSLIPRGAEQPISLAELSRLSGMDGRQLRSLLYHLVTVHHVPTRSYWWPTWLPQWVFYCD